MNYKFELNPDINFQRNIDLRKYTTFKLKVVGDLCIVKSESALLEIVEELKSHDLIIHIIGWGANQIIEKVSNKLFIKLDFPFDRKYLSEVRSEYTLPASIGLNVLQSHAQKFGLKGWEVFTGIPASLGGAIFMNAGTNLGEISEILKEIRILDKNGHIRNHKVDKSSFSYRKNHFLGSGDIVLSAKLIHMGIDLTISEKIKDYMKLRKDTQPLNTFNCGCVFKNFDQGHRAGQFIDTVGLKDFQYKNLKVSSKHANFIENQGEATAEEFIEFTDRILDILELCSGIRFELEVKVY